MEETHCNISMAAGSDALDHSTCAELQSMHQREQTRKGTVDDVRIAEVSLAGRGYRLASFPGPAQLSALPY